MYTDHFGLRQRPFRSQAAGTDVFVGPQTAAVMSSVKKALAVDDAVVTVSGPVGVGKTTVVRRALETVTENRIIISIGRLQLGCDEVIELLLAGLGARQLPRSTIQRFAAFRRMLHQYGERGTRVFIVVEDAARLGIDALAELESLTAEDSGASSGASLVLMGTSGLAELLRDPLLARLKQRIRLRQVLQPLGAQELRGYLKHSFRLAGGEFDEVFEDGAADTLYRYTAGVPRVCNRLVDQVLTAAAEQRLHPVPPELIEKTAAEEIGLTVEHSVDDIRAALTQAEVDTTAAEAEAVAELEPAERQESVDVDTSETASSLALEPEEAAAPAPDTAPEPIAPPAAGSAPTEPASAPVATAADDDIPELIQDTLPDLEVLAPELAASRAADAAADAGAGPVEPVESAPEDDGAAEEVPPWERDPTLAELRPDLEALERAMAVAQGDDTDEPAPPPVEEEPAPETSTFVPEITLDREIQAKIDEATEALRQTETDIPTLDADDVEDQSLEATLAPDEKVQPLPRPVSAPDAARDNGDQAPAAAEPAASGPNDRADLDELASELARGTSIEDMDDKLAETLFGEEFTMMAAEAAALAGAASSANDDVDLALEPEPAVTAEDAAPVAPADKQQPPAVDAKPVQAAKPLDDDASERLATVRALNKGKAPNGAPATPEAGESIVMETGVDAPKPQASSPTSIEEQMNTSMTQTLKALNVRNARASNSDDDDDGGKRGFFSRFRRS